MNMSWARQRAAVLIVVTLWIIWLVIQFITGAAESTHEALMHGEQFQWSEYIVDWVNKVAENNASEMFQVAVAAWVFKHFLYVGSPESKDEE